MSAILYGTRYTFGVPAELPFELPPPWVWLPDPEDFLMAMDGEGNRYIVNGEELHLVRPIQSGWEIAEEPPTNRRP